MKKETIMDALANTLGILGSCLTVLIVLSIAVETILEPLTLFKGLRKKIDPAELVGDLKEWVPGDSAAGRKIEELAGFNAGMLLTGLAASAGSSYWHDMPARVRAAKTMVTAKWGGWVQKVRSQNGVAATPVMEIGRHTKPAHV